MREWTKSQQEGDSPYMFTCTEAGLLPWPSSLGLVLDFDLDYNLFLYIWGKKVLSYSANFFYLRCENGSDLAVRNFSISAFSKMNTTIVLPIRDLYCAIFRILFSFEFSLVNQIRESHQFQKVMGAPGFFALGVTVLKYAVRLCCLFDHATTVCGTNFVVNLKKVIFFLIFPIFLYDEHSSLLRKNSWIFKAKYISALGCAGQQ